ncbi:MAG: hypothetical protein BWX88_02455 [Planctomycetes bacterium ADurb.Bin126]|nr:MAG: hypothetical protein BWX88_02455 [Planctomycetes bacterium ADurb.Bin126]HOD81191.1 AbrB/MazE/SpoVT family DNA-binding domain-containing protein [Phycisphaerae bacterium]HQL72452.1 AbrB/MazE/SpoVT family DNA-binding domain-containing protein [Phycisphaerae bacterium]
MIKQLTKVGNSSAVVLDKAIMELLGLEENARIQLTVNGRSLTISPVNPSEVDPEQFEKHLSDIVRERRAVLRKLAR